MAQTRKLTVDLDKLTLGDLETISGSGDMNDIIEVFIRLVHLEGVPDEDQEKEIRGLHWTAIKQIAQKLNEAVQEEVNPEVNGKN